jgi:hypothetical protein
MCGVEARKIRNAPLGDAMPTRLLLGRAAELRPKRQPEPVRMHDFLIPKLGRAVPDGVYDTASNAGWVSVGIDHD